METRKPEKVFHIGYVSALIFSREVKTENGNRTLRSVNLQKRYMDGDEVKYTSSFGLAEIPQALRVLELAQQHIEQHEVS